MDDERRLIEELAAEAARLRTRLREVEGAAVPGPEPAASGSDDARLLAQVLDAVEDGISVLDPALRIIRVNQRMERWYAHAMPVVGRPCHDVYHGRHEPCEACPARLAIDRKTYHKAEVPYTTPQGVVGALELHAYPVLDDAGTVTAVVEILRDVSERARADEQRQHLQARVLQAQKLESLGVLAGGIAHDFNNLLMAILGNADLAQAELSPTSPVRHYLSDIENSARRAAELARQMLAYSGRGRFVVEPIDLSALVREFEQLLAVSVAKSVVLTYHLARHLPPVEADASQMKQLLMNLVTNASEAIGARSGVVSVSTGLMHCDREYLREVYLDEGLSEGRYAFIEVADSGPGVDVETRAKLFDPFFTTKFTGRGLGLAAVLGLVRGHKGAIKVYSEPGRGSTFKILLPMADTDKVAGREGGEIAQPIHRSGLVLLVDDEEEVRRVGRRMLQKLGFEVLLAADGREALALFDRHGARIVVVVLDLTMPHLDGEETFRELRRRRGDVAVILSSGYNEQDVTQRFVGKGLAGFIQKPYQIATLRAKLQEVLGPDLDGGANPTPATPSGGGGL